MKPNPDITFKEWGGIVFWLAIVVLAGSLEAHWDHKEIITYPKIAEGK